MGNMYRLEISDPRLNQFRVIRASDPYTLQTRVQAQRRAWDDMWNRRVEANQRKAKLEAQARKREAATREKSEKIALAVALTSEAERALAEAQDILSVALESKPVIDWEAMKDRSAFPEPEPTSPRLPTAPPKPDNSSIPPKLGPDDPRFQPSLTFIESLIPGRKQREIERAKEEYEAYREARNAAVRDFNQQVADYNDLLKRLNMQYAQEVASHKQQIASWAARRQAFEAEQRSQYQLIERRKKAYIEQEPDAVLSFCETVLADSHYPAWCPQTYDCDYIAESKTLVIDYYLPRIEDVPSRKAVKYNQTQDKFVYSDISESALNKLYEEVNYRIALRTLFELFHADVAGALNSIAFNGIVDTVDKATGHSIKPCIMSIQVSRNEFKPLKLEQVDPKVCFKKLKGVSAAKLQALAPVAPVVQINREDKRFIESRDVADSLDDAANLASMHWEDFEHLIRELFAKEFGREGGEVKITQASRDGGVDAVAFDPDPIRGGKIVIQAKRYTNVVGPAAVRDLWGTILNEGAMKGILVTTSHYGAEAYQFAKGKPITLLDGGNLLHLLAKHGHRARIDLKEARKELASGNSAG